MQGIPETAERRQQMMAILEILVTCGPGAKLFISGSKMPSCISFEKFEEARKICPDFRGWPVWFFSTAAQRFEQVKKTAPATHFTTGFRGADQYLSQVVVFPSRPTAVEKEKIQFDSSKVSLVVVNAEKICTFPPEPCHAPDQRYSVAAANLVRDIVFFLKPSQGAFVPTALSNVIQSAGMPIGNESVDAVALWLNTLPLSKNLSTTMNTLVYRDYLLRSLLSMGAPDYDFFSTSFYSVLFNVRVVEDRYLTRPEHGLSLKYSPEERKADPSKARALVRTRPYKEKCDFPADIDNQLKFLAAERAVRGEDDSRANFFGQYSGRGTYATKERVQMCDMLSLIYPLIDKQEKIHVVPPSQNLAYLLLNFIVEKEWKGVHVRLFDALSPHSSNPFTVLQSDESAVLLDFRGMCLPMPAKKMDTEATWKAMRDRHFEPIKGYPRYIVKVKASGHLMISTGKKYFKFHSSHAFDCLETTFSSLDRRVLIHRYYEVKDTNEFLHHSTLPQDESLQQINSGTWNLRCFTDSRSRTWSFLNKDYGPVDMALNLWGSKTSLTKADIKARSREFLKFDDFEEHDFSQFVNARVQSFANLNAPDPVLAVAPVPAEAGAPAYDDIDYDQEGATRDD